MSSYPNKARFDKSSPKVLLNFDQVFKDVKILGAGGFGETHLVTDLLSGKKYALKLLHPKGFDKMGFYREVSALMNLSASPDCDPNIVCYYNNFIVQGYTNYKGQYIRGKYYGILTEYINGVTLAKFDETYRLTVNDIIYVGLWTLNMLKFLHSNGFAHNDISDNNIMVSNKKLKLIDLGLTCYSNTNGPLKCDIIGFNKFYASPELISGYAQNNFKKYSKTSDVYATGILIYNLLTGKRPYRENIRGKIIGPYQPIGIPCLDKLLSNMLLINPDKRATASQAYQLLKSCQ